MLVPSNIESSSSPSSFNPKYLHSLCPLSVIEYTFLVPRVFSIIKSNFTRKLRYSFGKAKLKSPLHTICFSVIESQLAKTRMTARYFSILERPKLFAFHTKIHPHDY